VLFLLRPVVQTIDEFQGVAEGVAAAELILDLAEKRPDLVFDGVGVTGPVREPLEVEKEIGIHERDEVVARHRGVVIHGAIRCLRNRPARPAVRVVEQVVVGLPHEFRGHRPFLLQIIEMLQEQRPGGLLGVVQLGTTPGFLPQRIVDVLECLLKPHAALNFTS